MFYKIRLFFITLSIVSASLAFAKKQYITDVLYVPIRSGTSNQHKVLKTLKTGTKVTVIEVSDDGAYTNVKTDEGQSGWLKSRYLVQKPVAASRLAWIEKKLEKMKEGEQPLRASISTVKKDLQLAQAENKALKRKNENLSTELKKVSSIAGNEIALNKKNEELQTQVSELNKELANVTNSFQVLEKNSQNEGFKLGAGAIILGLLMGCVAPYIKPRKRQNGGIRIR